MLTAVIPTLNEARALPALLAALGAEVDAIVVSDGGSTDATVALARDAGARVVVGPPGRGAQLRAGAAAAPGDRLWFVHADTEVPPGAGAAIRAAGTAWGCFSVRIDSGDPRLRWCAWWMNRRARRTGVCSGDMGMWMDRALYDRLGGFLPTPILEDLALADRARATAPWSVLSPPLGTSARRWERHGTSRTILRMWLVRAGFRLGVPPERLAAAYRPHPA